MRSRACRNLIAGVTGTALAVTLGTASLAEPAFAARQGGAGHHGARHGTTGGGTLVGAVGNTKAQIQQAERQLGGHLATVRVFRAWGQPLNSSDIRWMMQTNHRPILSVQSKRKGHAIPWRAVANAKPGSSLYRDMQTMAAQIKSLGGPVFFIYNHEPDAGASSRLGSPADFQAAWRKVYSVFQQQHATNAKFVWTLTAWAFQKKGKGAAASYYPGDAYVWGVGGDAYNWSNCRDRKGKWRELAQIAGPVKSFADAHHKAALLPEFASDEGPAGRKAQWIQHGQSLFKQAGWGTFAAVAWWGGVNNEPQCKFTFMSSSSAQHAFGSWTKDGYYQHTGRL
jgi:hypothetical protein